MTINETIEIDTARFEKEGWIVQADENTLLLSRPEVNHPEAVLSYFLSGDTVRVRRTEIVRGIFDGLEIAPMHCGRKELQMREEIL